MNLKLFWKDSKNVSYHLADLLYENEKYILKTKEENLKDAIKHGCFGIGNFGFLKNHYESNKLFDFFKNRIPSKDNSKIDKILQDLNIKEYNEMEILKATKGILVEDRYYLE